MYCIGAFFLALKKQLLMSAFYLPIGVIFIGPMGGTFLK
jgi:hypothetical protein